MPRVRVSSKVLTALVTRRMKLFIRLQWYHLEVPQQAHQYGKLRGGCVAYCRVCQLERRCFHLMGAKDKAELGDHEHVIDNHIFQNF